MEPVSATTGTWAKIAAELKDWPLWLFFAVAISLTVFVLVPEFRQLVSPVAANGVLFAAVAAWIVAGCRAVPLLSKHIHATEKITNRLVFRQQSGGFWPYVDKDNVIQINVTLHVITRGKCCIVWPKNVRAKVWQKARMAGLFSNRTARRGDPARNDDWAKPPTAHRFPNAYSSYPEPSRSTPIRDTALSVSDKRPMATLSFTSTYRTSASLRTTTRTFAAVAMKTHKHACDFSEGQVCAVLTARGQWQISAMNFAAAAAELRQQVIARLSERLSPGSKPCGA